MGPRAEVIGGSGFVSGAMWLGCGAPRPQPRHSTELGMGPGDGACHVGLAGSLPPVGAATRRIGPNITYLRQFKTPMERKAQFFIEEPCKIVPPEARQYTMEQPSY